MRKLNFNSFNNFKKEEPVPEAPKKNSYSAYRTIISRHEAAAERLKDEPSAVITKE